MNIYFALLIFPYFFSNNNAKHGKGKQKVHEGIYSCKSQLTHIELTELVTIINRTMTFLLELLFIHCAYLWHISSYSGDPKMLCLLTRIQK